MLKEERKYVRLISLSLTRNYNYDNSFLNMAYCVLPSDVA
jgi:hypothetical protein